MPVELEVTGDSSALSNPWCPFDWGKEGVEVIIVEKIGFGKAEVGAGVGEIVVAVDEVVEGLEDVGFVIESGGDDIQIYFELCLFWLKFGWNQK